jgi:hypothetical protein
MHQRDFVPIYAPGVTLGISRKMQKEPGRIVGNRSNRPVKGTCNQRMENYGHLSGLRVMALSGVFAAAFGFLEAVVVVYLRAARVASSHFQTKLDAGVK